MFSFIMPCYKRQFLGKAIESILAQTYDDFELVVVNDASPEKLYEVVNSISDPRLRYEENITNLGGRDLVACWNFNLSNRGEWSLALDQMKASNMFMQWLTGHLESIGTDFYTQRAFYGFREQYRYMISNLIQKVPIIRLLNVFMIVCRSKYLYKKEKVKALLNCLF
jgi:hypothetical protein